MTLRYAVSIPKQSFGTRKNEREKCNEISAFSLDSLLFYIMIIAKVKFKKLKNGSSVQDDLRDLAEGYLGSLRKFGQIYGNSVLAWSKNELYGLVKLASIDAFSKKYHTKYSLDNLKEVKNGFGCKPGWKIVENSSRDVINWKKNRFFYFFTHAFDETSPLCSSEMGMPIPLYLLPLSDLEREKAYFWASSYRYHDKIWLDSGKLEMAAYKQLVKPESGLSKEGRNLCKKIENMTKIPTYYFLNRYWGRKVGEENRLCPGCGKKWRVKEDDLDRNGCFNNFVFRCESCKLVSHIGNSFEDKRKARIGEYKKSKKSLSN